MSEWSPPSPTTKEIETKISSANKRRSEHIKENVQKSAAQHNQSVVAKLEIQKINEDVGSTLLEHKILGKIASASTNKEKLDLEQRAKITQANAKKLLQGTVALKQMEESKTQLEVKVEEKVFKASHKKEKLMAEKSNKLSKVTLDKIQRGAEALRKQEEESKSLEATIESKVASAINRKDERIAQVVDEKVKAHSVKANRKENTYKKTHDASRQLESSIQAKIMEVTQRKEDRISKSINEVSNKNHKKLAKSKRAFQRFESAKKKLDATIKSKLISVSERKKIITQNQVQSLAKATNDKLAKGENAMKKVEAEAIQLDQDLAKKMDEVSCRKEKQMAAQVQEIVQSSSTKKKHVSDVLNNQENALRELDANIQIKFTSAVKRKEYLTHKNIQQISLSNKKKEEKTLELKQKHDNLSQRMQATLEEKLNQAADRKEKLLIQSSEKKSQKSTNSSSGSSKTSSFSASSFSITPTKEQIMQKLENASARREILLQQRSEQAAFHSNRKHKIGEETVSSDLGKSTSDLLGTSEPNFVACSPIPSIKMSASNVLIYGDDKDLVENQSCRQETENEKLSSPSALQTPEDSASGSCVIL